MAKSYHKHRQRDERKAEVAAKCKETKTLTRCKYIPKRETIKRIHQNNMHDAIELSSDMLDSESSNNEEIVENLQDLTTSIVSLL